VLSIGFIADALHNVLNIGDKESLRMAIPTSCRELRARRRRRLP
jgi:hypothetical protein